MNRRKAFHHRYIWPITDAIRSALGRFVYRTVLAIWSWQLDVSGYQGGLCYPHIKRWAIVVCAPALFVLRHLSPGGWEHAHEDSWELLG
jgi:hypothetical protein